MDRFIDHASAGPNVKPFEAWFDGVVLLVIDVRFAKCSIQSLRQRDDGTGRTPMPRDQGAEDLFGRLAGVPAAGAGSRRRDLCERSVSSGHVRRTAEFGES